MAIIGARAPVAALSLLCLLPALASAQNPGEVLWYQKISAAAGNGPKSVQSFDQFGRAACVIGDLDADGVQDLAVGAVGDDDLEQVSSKDYGAVWILFMKPDGRVKSSKKIGRTSAGLPLDAGDEFGRAVRELGDFDQDGIPDIMASANYDDDNGTDKGAFYLLFLRRDGTVKSWKKISEISGGFTGDLDPDDQFGRGLRLLGDLDLDGVEDIGVGAIRDDDGGSNRGCYWILFMRRDGTVKSHAKLSETAGNFQSTLSNSGEFGFDCALLGDRNGDGIQDIAICAPDQNTGGLQQGAVFVVYLNRNGTAKADFRIAENYAGFNGNMLDYNDEFGCCIDALGDLDRDGNVDIAVGAGKDDDGVAGSVDKGAVYILFLKADATVKAWQKISQGSGRFRGDVDNGDRFGTSLACPGDLSGDGIGDLFVGVRFNDDGGSGAGCVFFLALNDGRFTPPTADFTGAPRRGPAPHAVQFSDQSLGDVSSWSWSFGDGGTSSERDPLHTYQAPGDYSVRLDVEGPAGASDITFVKVIKVDPWLPPVAAFEAAPTAGQQPLTVQFSDLSSGVASFWSWDFGDGSSSSARHPAHTYDQPGIYTVALTTSGPGGSRTVTQDDLVTVTPAPAPVADFAADQPTGPAPLAVQFTDLSSGPITSWAWDFGDGSSASVPSPAHVFTLPGSYTVTLAVAGPGGTDLVFREALITVETPPPPACEFGASPVSGAAPLVVSFADLSSGVVSSWSWDFGDGNGSSLRHPLHTYDQPGAYTVTLTVAGLGGVDLETKLDLITVSVLRRGLLDPSFEQGLAGSFPAGAWDAFVGPGHVVEPSGAPLGDGALPSDGGQWLRISSAGTNGASPPTNPGGETLPASGGAGVEQSFYLAEALHLLSFDAAFVRGGAAQDLLANDWMSVDVTDGVRTVNLFYADTFTSTPGVSARLGLPMTAVTTTSADLRALFPDALPDALFTLTLQVGNGGDGSLDSYGLLDDFRLEQAPGTSLRYGCGTNPVGSLSVLSGTPRLNTSMTLGLDNPLGTQGTSRAYLWLSRQPDPAYPCGSPAANLGMAGPGASGEFLVLRTPATLIKTVVGGLWNTPGIPAPVVLAMPTAASWIGTPLHVQGYLLDPAVTYGVRVGLTDALKLLIGP